jgi:Tfp pilus assembly protein PilF
VEAARAAVRANPGEASARNTLGAILYRAGQDAEAVKELNEAIRLQKYGGAWADCVFLAMAHQRLGQPADAKSWMAKAEPLLGARQGEEWEVILEKQVLRREVEALLKEPPPDPKN